MARFARFSVLTILLVLLAAGGPAVFLVLKLCTNKPSSTERAETSLENQTTGIPEEKATFASWDRSAAAAQLLLLFTEGVRSNDPTYLAALRTAGPAAVRRLIEMLSQTEVGPEKDLPGEKRDLRERKGRNPRWNHAEILMALTQLDVPLEGAASDILGWARDGKAAGENRHIVTAMSTVGGPNEGGRAAGELLRSEIERYIRNPNFDRALDIQYLVTQLTNSGLVGADQELISLVGLVQGTPGARFSVSLREAQGGRYLESEILTALARLDTSDAVEALSNRVQDLSDAPSRDAVLIAIAKAAGDNPNGRLAARMREWASSRLSFSNSFPQAERMAALAVSAGMEPAVVQVLASNQPPKSDKEVYRAWVRALSCAAIKCRSRKAADVCGELIEHGLLSDLQVDLGEELSRTLVQGYVFNEPERKRIIQNRVASSSPLEAIYILGAFPSDSWGDNQESLFEAMGKFAASQGEESFSEHAASMAADLWVDASKNKAQAVRLLEETAPRLVNRRHRNVLSAPLTPMQTLTEIHDAIKHDESIRSKCIRRACEMAADRKIDVIELAQYCSDLGLDRRFVLAIAQGLLKRESSEARALAENLLLRLVQDSLSSGILELMVWKEIVVLAVRDRAGIQFARKCLSLRKSAVPLEHDDANADKIAALADFVERSCALDSMDR